MLDLPEIPEAISNELAEAISDTTKPARVQIGTTLESLAYFYVWKIQSLYCQEKN